MELLRSQTGKMKQPREKQQRGTGPNPKQRDKEKARIPRALRQAHLAGGNREGSVGRRQTDHGSRRTSRQTERDPLSHPPSPFLSRLDSFHKAKEPRTFSLKNRVAQNGEEWI